MTLIRDSLYTRSLFPTTSNVNGQKRQRTCQHAATGKCFLCKQIKVSLTQLTHDVQHDPHVFMMMLDPPEQHDPHVFIMILDPPESHFLPYLMRAIYGSLWFTNMWFAVAHPYTLSWGRTNCRDMNEHTYLDICTRHITMMIIYITFPLSHDPSSSAQYLLCQTVLKHRTFGMISVVVLFCCSMSLLFLIQSWWSFQGSK